MRLRPRYDGPAVVQFEGRVGDVSIPFVRQRRRLGSILSGFDDRQWATASRCEGWSVKDVVAHLVGTNGFWLLSAAGAIAGEPTRYLSDFDPVATPKLGVDAMQALAPADVLAKYLDGVEQLAAALSGLDDAQWTASAEAPPGHVALHAMVRHGLWDAWIHERDVCIPLGIETVDEADELRACLEYVAALGPACLATEGSTRSGALVVDGVLPDAHVVVEAGASVIVHGGNPPHGAARLTGSTADLIEALSFRAPFPEPVAEDDRWLVSGLGAVFEVL